jgi:hypothetical protein
MLRSANELEPVFCSTRRSKSATTGSSRAGATTSTASRRVNAAPAAQNSSGRPRRPGSPGLSAAARQLHSIAATSPNSTSPT